MIPSYIKHSLMGELTSFFQSGQSIIVSIHTWLSADSRTKSNTHLRDRPEVALLLTALRRAGNCYDPHYTPHLGL